MKVELASAQLAFALWLVFLFPLFDLPLLLRLRRQTSSKARLRVYYWLLLMLWGTTGACYATLGDHVLLSLPGTGLVPGWISARGGVYLLVLGLVLALLALNPVQGLRCVLRPAVRPVYGRALRPLRFLLPVSKTERAWWGVVSLSAGVCEEVLFRGFLLGYLRGQLDGGPHLSLLWALGLSSLSFGTGHLYQGRKEFIGTALFGAALGLLAVLTGSLILPMVLHASVDAAILAMYRPGLDAPEEAAALIAGCPGPPATGDRSLRVASA